MVIFDRLPDELLAEIIHHSTHISPFPSRSAPEDGLKQLKLLLDATSISSRWRSVAISTPQLWSWIVIADHTFHRGTDVGRSVVEAFIERSKNASIDIYLAIPLFDEPSFMRVYGPVIPHLRRCSSFSCFRLRNEIVDQILPLHGDMPRLSTVRLVGDVDGPPKAAFTKPSSLTALRNMIILGVPMLPIHPNSIDQLTIGLSESLPMWALPFIASSTNVTRLKLEVWEDDMLGEVPSTRIHLPRLKVLQQAHCTIAPFLDAPALDEFHWLACWLGVKPVDGHTSSFPALTKLYLNSPFPFYDTEPPPRKLDFPSLKELRINEAVEVSTFLRGLLLPHTLDPAVERPEGAASFLLPYPALQVVELKVTNPEDLTALRNVLVDLLEEYQNTRLEYDSLKTFPSNNDQFWGELRKVYGARVLSVSG
ncbi:hypothetical protein DL93DRAFT_2081619 [Clavulina sp. PMI_390]|nr:hypothetical protein DL93DRAFT_2081619 [Clavulina sp. PMI_390]